MTEKLGFPAPPILRAGTYLVLAHTLDFLEPVPSLFDPSRPRIKVMGAYQSAKLGEEAEQDVFQQFLKEWASTKKDAQRFYNEVTIVHVTSESAIFKMSDALGELLKFPNPEVFTHVDQYF